jgi:hypothetical protein
MGALIPLALTIAPEIGKWLFGADAEKTTAAVAQVVQTVTGAGDADAAQAVLAPDPATAAQLRLKLEQIAAQQQQENDKASDTARQAQLDELKAHLADGANARQQSPSLVGQHSAIAYGAFATSPVVLATFGIVMTIALTKKVPAGSEIILNMLLGTLAAMATSVVSYWVGSSACSARKEARLAQMQSSPAETTQGS